MNKSACFIALLVISLCACTRERLNDFANTAEGKRVFQNMLLQSKLTQSGHLDIAEVRTVISQTLGHLDEGKKQAKELVEENHENCENSIKVLAGLANDARGIFLGNSRRLENAKNELSVRTAAEERAEAELTNYRQLQGFVTKNLENWEAYWDQAKESLDHVIRVVEDIRQHLTTHVTDSAFIQMGDKYHTGLAQIKIKLAGLNNDYSEMKPIISNLIGIMQDQPQLSKAAVRLGLKALFHHISEYVAEKRDEISEEDAHIRGLFSTLQKALQDNIDRAEAGVNVIKDIFNFLHAKVGSLESFTAGSETVTKAAEHILEEKGHLCQEFQQHASHAKIAYSKVEHIVSQLQEVLAVDGANLESFLQKNMKVMKKN
jgi:hypothetical protein